MFMISIQFHCHRWNFVIYNAVESLISTITIIIYSIYIIMILLSVIIRLLKSKILLFQISLAKKSTGLKPEKPLSTSKWLTKWNCILNHRVGWYHIIIETLSEALQRRCWIFLRRKFFRYFSNFQLPRFDSQERWLFLIRGLCVSSCIFSGSARKLSVNSGWQNRIFIQKNRLHFHIFQLF